MPSLSGFHVWHLLFYSPVSTTVSPMSLPVGPASVSAYPGTLPVSMAGGPTSSPAMSASFTVPPVSDELKQVYYSLYEEDVFFLLPSVFRPVVLDLPNPANDVTIVWPSIR